MRLMRDIWVRLFTWAARRGLLPRLYLVFFRRGGEVMFGGAFSSLEMLQKAIAMYQEDNTADDGVIFVSAEFVDHLTGDKNPEGWSITGELGRMRDERAAAGGKEP